MAQLVKKVHLQSRRPQFNSWLGKILWRRGRLPTPVFLGLPGGSEGKESACNAGHLGSSLGWEDHPEEGMATHSSILAWRTPWTEEPGGPRTVHRVARSWTWLSAWAQHGHPAPHLFHDEKETEGYVKGVMASCFSIHVLIYFLTFLFLLWLSMHHIKFTILSLWVQFSDINKFLLLCILLHCPYTEWSPLTSSLLTWNLLPLSLNSPVNLIPISVSMNLPILSINTSINKGFTGGASGKEPSCQCRRYKTCKLDPWEGKIPWSRKW